MKIIQNFSVIILSKVIIGIVGIAVYPIIIKNLTPSEYGNVSLFIVSLAMVQYIDFTRQLFIKKLYAKLTKKKEVRRVEVYNFVIISFIGCLVGLTYFRLEHTILILITIFFYAISSRRYALLVLNNHAGYTQIAKDIPLSLGLVAAAIIANFSSNINGIYYSLSIGQIIGSIIILSKDLRTCKNDKVFKELENGSTLNESKFYSDAALLFLFNASVIVVANAHRFFLERFIDPIEFGIYSAHIDMILRINIISTAIATIAYPILVKEENKKRIAVNYIKTIHTLIYIYLIISMILIAYYDEVIDLVIGKEYLTDNRMGMWVLISVSVQIIGFMVTQLQRSNDNFKTSTAYYLASAIIILFTGYFLTPIIGVTSAIIMFYVPRIFEIKMLYSESKKINELALMQNFKILNAVIILMISFTTYFYLK